MDKSKKPSYGIIILWFILFWPVGVILLIKRLTNDKSAPLKNSKVLSIIGIGFLVCAGFVLIACFDAGEDAGSLIGAMLFYLGGGVLLLYVSKRVKASGERYKKYIDIVINQEQYTIENIAAQAGTSYEKTVRELQDMIDKGYFANAHIDHASHEIVFPSKKANISAQAVQSNVQSIQQQFKVVKCPNCGGNNTIVVGQTCECDFCGSALQ